MNAERRTRLIKLARERGDRAAVAILEADREYRPEPDYPVFGGLRWVELRIAA